MAIEVSLCGPGSLLTATLGPTDTLRAGPGLGSGANPGAETVWNFCHQVGRLYVEAPVLVSAEAGSAEPAASARLAIDAAAVKARSRAIAPPLSHTRLFVSTACSHGKAITASARFAVSNACLAEPGASVRRACGTG